MDNTTIYEFLQEKSVTPTGPGSYSDSTEMSNALKVFKKNNSKVKRKKDVNFYDYDGSLVDSYSAEEFLQLSAMPANPSHESLTAQGWNYTLSDAKEYVSDYGKLNIGQMYITDDGKTRIHIKLEEGRLKPQLGFAIDGSAIIDWGDNSATDTVEDSDLTTVIYKEHTYPAAGEYVISIDVTGEFTFYGKTILTKADGNANTNKTYLNCIQSVYLGSGITSIDNSAFDSCSSLTSVTIPNSVTSIGGSAFVQCLSLGSIIIPSSTITIGSYAFQYCQSLTSIIIPNSIISIGEAAFATCTSLTNIIIPNTVSTISQRIFSACASLANMVIPDSVTTIEQNAFYNCLALANIVISDSITNIGQYAFCNCCGLGFIKFKGTTPPTVEHAIAWSNVPTDCIIYVPQGSLSAYTSASNYPDPEIYTYIEY